MNTQLDGFGVQGLYLCVAAMITFSGSTALVFFHFWRKGKLGFEEDAKHQMMKEDHNDQQQ